MELGSVMDRKTQKHHLGRDLEKEQNALQRLWSAKVHMYTSTDRLWRTCTHKIHFGEPEHHIQNEKFPEVVSSSVQNSVADQESPFHSRLTDLVSRTVAAMLETEMRKIQTA